ncbi:MAG: hypothetical protein Q9224_004525 [Gallowayella concinna]
MSHNYTDYHSAFAEFTQGNTTLDYPRRRSSHLRPNLQHHSSPGGYPRYGYPADRHSRRVSTLDGVKEDIGIAGGHFNGLSTDGETGLDTYDYSDLDNDHEWSYGGSSTRGRTRVTGEDINLPSRYRAHRNPPTDFGADTEWSDGLRRHRLTDFEADNDLSDRLRRHRLIDSRDNDERRINHRAYMGESNHHIHMPSHGHAYSSDAADEIPPSHQRRSRLAKASMRGSSHLTDEAIQSSIDGHNNLDSDIDATFRRHTSLSDDHYDTPRRFRRGTLEADLKYGIESLTGEDFGAPIPRRARSPHHSGFVI